MFFFKDNIFVYCQRTTIFLKLSKLITTNSVIEHFKKRNAKFGELILMFELELEKAAFYKKNTSENIFKKSKFYNKESY